MRRTCLFALCLLDACAARAPALHENPVVKVEYRGEKQLTEEQRKETGSPPWVTELYKGSGSGFFVNRDGVIVTNYHVIAKRGVQRLEIIVTVDDRWRYPARVLHADPEADLAVIRIDADKETWIPFLPLGLAAGIGAELRVQGYPGGGPFRQTVGNVMRTGALLECTIPVRIGNSGGPALWSDNTVAGVVTGLRKRAFRGPGANVAAEFSLLVPVETLRVRLAGWKVSFD